MKTMSITMQKWRSTRVHVVTLRLGTNGARNLSEVCVLGPHIAINPTDFRNGSPSRKPKNAPSALASTFHSYAGPKPTDSQHRDDKSKNLATLLLCYVPRYVGDLMKGSRSATPRPRQRKSHFRVRTAAYVY
ncbi:hypothetical protein N7G274_004401 [Stereocaulon virgatum]|uniref:Uncharacterized protein n=1 Tax=Stereocaulon virgatum TaxID=373712 RepID=A0ABR4A9S8_9LECA